MTKQICELNKGDLFVSPYDKKTIVRFNDKKSCENINIHNVILPIKECSFAFVNKTTEVEVVSDYDGYIAEQMRLKELIMPLDKIDRENFISIAIAPTKPGTIIKSKS